MSGGQNIQRPSDMRQPMRYSNDASLVSTEKAHRAFLGYTIVEVMIFLAVSGVMFLIAATFISGKQANVQFHNDVNLLSTDVTKTANDVANGTYDNPASDLTCPASGAGMSQGTNVNCIFLGKALYFSATAFTTQAISGNRLDGTGNDVTGLTAAAPTFMSQTTTTSLNSLTVDLMCVTPIGGAATASYGFALVNTPAGGAPSAGSGTSGSVGNVTLYGFSNDPSLGTTPAINGLINPAEDPLSNVVIYVSSGNKWASININGTNGLSTSISYFNAPHGGSCP